jgi:STE24 endopeptidase
MSTDVIRLDLERQERAGRYATTRRVLSLLDLGVSAAYAILLIGTGGALAFRDLLTAHLGSTIVVNAGFLVAFAFVLGIITLPLTILSGWWLPRRFGLSTQSLGLFAGDLLKGTGISLVIGLAVVEVVYLLLAESPSWWWLFASALYVAFVIVLANLAPVLLVPLFFRLTPLPASALTERLEVLALRLGVRVHGVFRMDLSAKTTAANAALMGFGTTRRIVLGDTLLNHFTTDEIEVVFAHELGHQAHRDITRLIATQSLLTLASLYVCSVALRLLVVPLGYASLADVANLPLIALIVGLAGTITGPISNALSRQAERAADAFALQTTKSPDAFISAMTRLANQNLAEYDPDRLVEILFYDHPSIRSRIRFAEEFAHRRVPA